LDQALGALRSLFHIILGWVPLLVAPPAAPVTTPISPVATPISLVAALFPHVVLIFILVIGKLVS